MPQDTVVSLPKIDIPTKVKLSVPLIAAYLKEGYHQSQIASICKVSKQAVNDYIKRHLVEFKPLLDNDNYMAMQCKYVADKGMAVLVDVLDQGDFNKRDMAGLTISVGTMIDKYRLFMGKSTQNIETHHKFMIDKITSENWQQQADANTITDDTKTIVNNQGVTGDDK